MDIKEAVENISIIEGYIVKNYYTNILINASYKKLVRGMKINYFQSNELLNASN